nr:DUF3231 family protein [Lederbergia sp. NSJ-179]
MFCLTYVNHMAKVGMSTYSGFVSMSYREDVCQYFSQGLSEINNLFSALTSPFLVYFVPIIPLS